VLNNKFLQFDGHESKINYFQLALIIEGFGS